ncbi:porin family protein [Halomonas sp. BM-2019]|uniref:porin family protein n=1 Tax=Halomonas sp. BM-2019 TaxID=2811227 RepID=UPI001B3C42C6|nr:MAG: porin family protein [Halomonas sp. BM-2019]
MKRLIATAALTTLVAAPALAQSYPGVPDEGFYLGTAIGQATFKNSDFRNLDDVDRRDTAFKLFAGYQFNPHFAVETSYVDFGDFTANDEDGEVKVDLDGFGFALVGRLPIEAGFSVYGKLGLIAWDGNVRDADGSRGDDDIDPFYGVGAEYVIDQVMMRLEFERYDMSASGTDFDTDLISASIGYRF